MILEAQKIKDHFYIALALRKLVVEMMNLLLGVQSTFDLSKVDFSSGLGINSPDLAGISFLMVMFAGVLALRLGTTLRDS